MIEIPFVGLTIAAFFLGIKHSLDVDHVFAVSSFLIRSPKFSRTFKLSIIWALGHTFTAGIVTIVIFFIKDLFIENILSHFEIIVAIMLISIGAFTLIWEFGDFKRRLIKQRRFIPRIKFETHNKEQMNENYNLINNTKSNRFSWIRKDSSAIAAVGIIQGLASNDELFLLLVFSLGINDLFLILTGIFIFSLGVVTGMIFWSTLLNLPGLNSNKEKLIKYLNIIIATLAIGYGIYCILGGKGLSLIPIIN